VTSTADILDEHGDAAAVCLLQFRSFGRPDFSGQVTTVECPEDNVLLRRQLEEPGDGRVLVVDGGGSLRCALLGDNIARLALGNGWAGVVVNGCVRDSAVLSGLELGVKALGTSPRPSRKEGVGATDVPITFGGITFTPGALLYADGDGVALLPSPGG
jgi:regulator of ribonuclease activity A